MSRSGYTIYGAPISLFTRKLEAAFDFYQLPCQSERKGTRDDSELEQRTGSHQIPQLVTPENWALADTTPILQLLDSRVPQRRLFPEGPLGLLVHIAEEVLDEWVARVMVHYRWHYLENTRDVLAFAFGVQTETAEEAAQHPIAQWGPRACRATGTELEEHQRAAEAEYLALMDALEAQLQVTRFALGDQPTAVDCMLLGGLRAHTHRDPIPDLSGYPTVLKWNEAAGRSPHGMGELAPFPNSTPFAQHLIELAGTHYAPFLLANAQALARGEKSFTIETYGSACSYLTRPYPEQSRALVHDRVRNLLTEAQRREAREWLASVGLDACFWPGDL